MQSGYSRYHDLMLFQLVVFENRNVELLHDALFKWPVKTSRFGNDPSEHSHLHDDIKMSSLAQNPYNSEYNGYMMRMAHNLHSSVLPIRGPKISAAVHELHGHLPVCFHCGASTAVMLQQ